MSVFLTEKQALFLHVPRTGGRWVKRALLNSKIEIDLSWQWKASDFYRIPSHALLGHYRADCFARVSYVFAFVRHPVKLYSSFWRIGKSAISRHEEHTAKSYFANKMRRSIEALSRWKPNFDEWLDEMLEEEPAWATRMFERFVGPEGGEFCHFIGRTETLEQDMIQVMSILGYRLEWLRYYREEYPKHRKRRRRKYHMTNVIPEVELTPEQVKRIERSERVMIRRFFGEETFKKRVYRNFKTGELS